MLIIAIMALISLQTASATLPGPFWPIDIALGDDGNVYVLAKGNSSVQDYIHVYSPDGREIRTIDVENRSIGEIALDGDGNLYLRDSALNISQTLVETIVKLDHAGNRRVIVNVSRDDTFIINGLAVGLDGTVYYSKYGASGQDPVDKQYLDTNRVMAVDGNGTTHTAYVADRDTHFTSLAVDVNGTVYACDFGGFVTVVHPDGNVSYIGRTNDYGRDGAFATLVGVDVGQDDYVYTTEGSQGGINRVQKLSPNGTPIAQWEGCGPYRFAGARSVAADKDGRIYVADFHNQRIVWFTGDYRFGDNVTQNLAGEGVLWGTLIFSGFDNSTWAAMAERENNPGLPYSLIGIALVGLVALDIIVVFLIRFYRAGKSFSRAGNAVVFGIVAIVTIAVLFILVFLLWSLFHGAFGYGYIDPLDRYLSAAEGAQLYSLFIVIMLAAGSLTAHVSRKKITDDKSSIIAGAFTGLCAAGAICSGAMAISFGQQLMSSGIEASIAYMVSRAPGMVSFLLVLPAAFAMPIAASGAFITRRYAEIEAGRSSPRPHHDLTTVVALAITIVLVALITADFALTYEVVPIVTVFFLLPLLVTLPALAIGIKWPGKTSAVPPVFVILALSAVAIVLVPMAEVLIATAIGIA
ncbi:MAG: NHL repeat-containing protein [Methanocella sp.]